MLCWCVLYLAVLCLLYGGTTVLPRPPHPLVAVHPTLSPHIYSSVPIPSPLFPFIPSLSTRLYFLFPHPYSLFPRLFYVFPIPPHLCSFPPSLFTRPHLCCCFFVRVPPHPHIARAVAMDDTDRTKMKILYELGVGDLEDHALGVTSMRLSEVLR